MGKANIVKAESQNRYIGNIFPNTNKMAMKQFIQGKSRAVVKLPKTL